MSGQKQREERETEAGKECEEDTVQGEGQNQAAGTERRAKEPRDPAAAGAATEPPESSGDTRETTEDGAMERRVEAGAQAALWDGGRLEDGDEDEGHDDVGSLTATVKVVLSPEGHVMTAAFAIGLSLQAVKHQLAEELRVPAEVLQFSSEGQPLEEKQSLMDLGVRPHDSIRLELSSSQPSHHPLRRLPPPMLDNMADVITVRVQTADGDSQQVVVEIERPPQQKLFLGGLRCCLSGATYHHAATQTAPRRGAHKGVAVVSRDTQTVRLSCQAQQAPVTVATQMTTAGCYVSSANDKLITPGDYTTAEQHQSRRLTAVIRLQAGVRRWLAQREVAELRRGRSLCLAWLEQQERMRREEEVQQLKERHRRWRRPRRREDFSLLYHALQEWRLEGQQQIVASLRGAERKAALCSLLEQETDLIATIGRHRIIAQNENRDNAIENFLDKCGAPRQWPAANNRLIQVDSEHTIRARELRDLYHQVNSAPTSQEQRLSVLTTLKHTAEVGQECRAGPGRDMVELIDREVELLTRGVKQANLQGLRKRISMLSLQLIKTPAFNPAVMAMLKVPQDTAQLRNNMFLCPSCRRHLRSADFSPCVGVAAGERCCRDCSSTENVGCHRVEAFSYQLILRKLRRAELKINPHTKIPFLLQVEDVRFLVEELWASRSALGSCRDLHCLLLVRWNPSLDWSPWNCILLSQQEATAHMQVQDIYQVYQEPFISSVQHKHTLARWHFSQIPAMATHINNLLPQQCPGVTGS